MPNVAILVSSVLNPSVIKGSRTVVPPILSLNNTVSASTIYLNTLVTVTSFSVLTTLFPVHLINRYTIDTEAVSLLLKHITPSISNTVPAFIVPETPDGLIIDDGFELKISGSVVSSNNDVPVTVKYKINEDSPIEISSTIVNSDIPVYFSKSLVYKDKLLWDGSNQVTPVELEEDVDHRLTILLEGAQGTKLDEKTIIFRVVWPARFNYKIQGSVTGFEDGSVLTVKYKVNDGVEYVIAAQVTNANEPLYFEKVLEYYDRRLWDGSIDVVGYDLALGIKHTITIWAEDSQGRRSEEIVRVFDITVIDPPDEDPFDALPPIVYVDTPDNWILG